MGRDRTSIRINTHRAIFVRAQTANSGYIWNRRYRRREIRGGICISRKDITALSRRGTRIGYIVINQARTRRRRNARVHSAGGEGCEACISGSRVGVKKRHLGRVDGTERTGCSRLVRSYLCPNQVRDRDRCNDQDDRNYDQQLNQGEADLFSESHRSCSCTLSYLHIEVHLKKLGVTLVRSA